MLNYQIFKNLLYKGIILIIAGSIGLVASAENSPQDLPDSPNAIHLSGDYLDVQSQVKDSDTTASSGFWSKLWGKPAPPALYLGMFTFHLDPNSRDDNWNNQLIAGTYDGFFAGTFINSFYDRGYALGIQRMWGKQQLSEYVSNSPGYRLGLVTGYDERMMDLAAHTPVLPFPQIIDDIVIGDHVGIELSWSVVVVSAGFVVTF